MNLFEEAYGHCFLGITLRDRLFKDGETEFQRSSLGSLQSYRKQVRLTLHLDLGNGEDEIGHPGGEIGQAAGGTPFSVSHL